VLTFHFASLFQSVQHFHGKREGSGAGSEPLTTGSGRPKKTMRIRIPNTRYRYSLSYLGKLLQAATLIGVGQPRIVLAQEGELVRVGGQHLSDPGRVLLITRPGAGRRCCGARRRRTAAA
jgi:hypothetical protein